MSLESNAFAPVAVEADFRERFYVEGGELLAQARRNHSVIPKEMSAFVRAMDRTGPWNPLPLVPASVNLLTASGPYGELIDYGQRRKRELSGAVLNVSVTGNFAFSDSPKNGLAVTVTARKDRSVAQSLAREIAARAWAMRDRFRKTLTPLGEGLALARRAVVDPASPAVIFSDAGDNPGGGSGTDAP